MSSESKLLESIEKHVGSSGRMISYSKSRYRASNPKNLIYFNACIYIVQGKEAKQIWWGDIDVTKDSKNLQAAAEEAGEKFYLTPEHGYRSDFSKVKPADLKNEACVLFGDKRK